MARLDKSAATKVAIILCAVAAIEGGFILAYPRVWLPAALRSATTVSPLAWSAAAFVSLGYVLYCIRGLPTVAALLGELSPYKLLAPVIAVPSSILEEVFFRNGVMNLLAAHHQNVIIQILASGITFGLVHAIWGIRGGMAALFGAVRSTTVLGLALAAVFVLAGRIVFPCVIAHFAINMVLEPWLLYAYVVRAQTRSRAT